MEAMNVQYNRFKMTVFPGNQELCKVNISRNNSLVVDRYFVRFVHSLVYFVDFPLLSVFCCPFSVVRSELSVLICPVSVFCSVVRCPFYVARSLLSVVHYVVRSVVRFSFYVVRSVVPSQLSVLSCPFSVVRFQFSVLLSVVHSLLSVL